MSAAEIVISFGDSSTTGNSVQADIDHSEVISVPLASAAATGSNSGAQNAAADESSVRVRGPGHVGKRRAIRASRDQRDDHRHRHIAGGAGQITERGPHSFGERLFTVNAHGVGKRREVVLLEPDQMRRQHNQADGNRDPWRRRAEIGAAAAVDQRGNDETGDQKDRPVFAQHGASGGKSGERGVSRAARRIRAQEPPCGRSPQRHQHGVHVEFQRMEIEERHQRQQRQAEDTLLDVEIIGRQPPDDPQRNRRHQHGEEIIGPAGDRKHGEPQPHHPGGERRVLVAQRQVLRPIEELDHVVVQALARFGDGAVKRPHRDVDRERQHDAALAPRRIAERAVQASDGGGRVKRHPDTNPRSSPRKRGPS